MSARSARHASCNACKHESHPFSIVPLLFAVAHPACKSAHETNAEPAPIASAPEIAPASAPTTPPGPTVSCLDLPRKGRLKMHVSEDQKTVYYVEVTHEMQASGERIPRYALVALDVATRTAKTLDDNVGTEVQVSKRGQIVFARSESGSTEYGDNRRLYIRARPSGTKNAQRKEWQGCAACRH
ncbi:MAG: hypothetical protein IPM54_45705 [Polyangiaceae bacterium]|nr:hypothetical protein [Polyangiaceae bacterium]